MSQGDLGALRRCLGVLTRGVAGLEAGVKPPSSAASPASPGEAAYRVRAAESVSAISLTGVTRSSRRGPSTSTLSGFKS